MDISTHGSINFCKKTVHFVALFLALPLISCEQSQVNQIVGVKASAPVSGVVGYQGYLEKARVQPVEVEEMNVQQKALLDIHDSQPLPKRAKSNLFKTLMNHPDMAASYFPMGDRANKSPEFSDKEREIIILRVIWLYQGQYEWSRHYDKALKLGWTAKDIERMKKGGKSDGWSPEIGSLLVATDQLVQQAFIDDLAWADLSKYHSTQKIMSLITIVTHYHWAAMTTKSLGIQPENEVKAFMPSPIEDLNPEVKRLGFVAFVEGPVALPDGSVMFTDVHNSRIMRWEKGGPPQIHRSPTGQANGLFLDPQGRLVIAETAGKLTRENLDGSLEVLAETFDGHPFNSLNDLVIDREGRIYFTDPKLRNRQKATQRDEDGKIIDGVYRLDPDGTLVRVLKHEIVKPNGLIISPDGKKIYIAENDGQIADGPRKIWRFDISSNGDLYKETKKLIYDFGSERGPDGMTIDVRGNLYVAAGLNTPLKNRTNKKYKAGIYVISDQGDLRDFIPVPMDNVSNVTFGGEDNKTLYITAGHSLWAYQNKIAGYKPF